MRNLRNYREYTNSMMVDEFSIGNMLPQVPLNSEKTEFDLDEDWLDTLATESAKNNKGKTVPKKCPKCGSPVRIFLRGEPVFLCSNKKCGKFFGVVPFKDTKESVNESVKRSELPDEVFGIPQERKYPMPDKKYVISAIKLFNHVEPKYEEQLANKILENIDKYNIDTSIIGEKNRLNKYIKESEDSTMENSLVKDLEFLYFEAGDPDIPDLIEPIVKQLESKGYQVKYASPGHINTTFDNDRNKDGVINSKMTSTARIIFSRDYHFKTTPQGWEWKILQNDSKALYVKPYTYNEKMGPKDEAFKKWQTFYISNIKSWVTDLPKAGSDVKTEPDANF